MRIGESLVVLFLVCGCADEPLPDGPPCTLATFSQSITYSGPADCMFRGDGIPGPWIDLDDCEIRVLVPVGQSCAEVGGREIEGEDDRARCVLPRLTVDDRSEGAPPPAGQGWFFDDFTDDMPCPLEPSPNTFRIEPTPLVGTVIELVCLTPVAPETGLDAYCFADSECEEGLLCDPLRDRCGERCESNADCRAAGLEGWICDVRPMNEIDPRVSDTTPSNFCVNPSCDPD